MPKLVGGSKGAHGWRASSRLREASHEVGDKLNNFGPIDPKTVRQVLQTKRNKKQKITLPKLKFMEGEEP